MHCYAPTEEELSHPVLKVMEDWELLHELAHWLVATPSERKLPEYGCDPIMVEYMASGYLDLGKPAERGQIAVSIQDWREERAYFLGMLFCYQLGVSFPIENHPLNSSYYKRNDSSGDEEEEEGTMTLREVERRLDEIEALQKAGSERDLLCAYRDLLADLAEYVRKQACRQPVNTARRAKLIDERIGNAYIRAYDEKKAGGT